MDFEEPWKASWHNLETCVTELQAQGHNPLLFSLIREKPLTPDSIDEILRQGWKIMLTGIPCRCASQCSYRTKTIYLDEGLEPYERDKALFHEIAHAWYGLTATMDDENLGEYGTKNNALVEWACRLSRANPEILRRAVIGFNLTPRIYDRASSQAFQQENKETRVFMD